MDIAFRNIEIDLLFDRLFEDSRNNLSKPVSTGLTKEILRPFAYTFADVAGGKGRQIPQFFHTQLHQRSQSIWIEAKVDKRDGIHPETLFPRGRRHPKRSHRNGPGQRIRSKPIEPNGNPSVESCTRNGTQNGICKMRQGRPGSTQPAHIHPKYTWLVFRGLYTR